MAALLFVVAAIVVPALFGLQRYVITGGSMTGTIPQGAIIYSRITPVEQLRAGDIITFHPPGFSTAVTHRIIAVEQGADGRPAFRTKGDFNETADPWGAVSLNEPRQARCVFHVPLLGYVLAALGARTVRIALIGVPAVLIALSLLWSLWREAGEEVVRRLEDDGVPHDARRRA
jgi:signal peptidase